MSKQEAVAVTLVSVLVFVPVGVGLYLFPATPTTWIGIPGCPNDGSLVSGSFNLTPESAVLIPRCEGLPVFDGILFTVHSAVDLRGSYMSTAGGTLRLESVAPDGQESSYWESLGGCQVGYCLGGQVFDVPVFPGTYWFGAMGGCGDGGCTEGYVVMTQPVVALFDRSMQSTPIPGNLTLAASTYAAWPVLFPANSTDIALDVEMTTTVCRYYLAILPPVGFQSFEADPGDFDLPNATILVNGWLLNCPGLISPQAVGPPLYGPLNVSADSELVFYNAGTTTGYLLSAPVEVAWVP